MGVMTPVRVLLFVAMLASLALAWLSVQTWAELRSWGWLGEFVTRSVPGTQFEAVTGTGDGKVLVLGSMMTLALSFIGIISRESRRLASVCVALAGTGMLALATYMTVNVSDALPFEFWTPGMYGYQATSIPYFAMASAFVIAAGGALASLLTPGSERSPVVNADVRPVRSTSHALGPETEISLRLIVWLTGTLAALAFVPWIDKHTLHILIDHGPIAITALGDAVLFASVALACSLLAYRMLRDPSELVWAGMVVAGGAVFVVAGSEIAESAQGCANNGTILGLLNGNILGGCYGGGGDAYSLSAGSAVGWIALIGSTVVALLGLALPIVELVSGNGESEERAGQW